MDDLRKINSLQLFSLWRNLTVGFVIVIAMMTLSSLLPYFLSPIISLICAAVLYTMLYNNKVSRTSSCMLVPYIIFFCLIAYTFTTIVINVMYAWGFIHLTSEFIFFNKPYIPSLIMTPVSFVVCFIFYLRRSHLSLCLNCKLKNGGTSERGILGSILSVETSLQIKNLTILFGLLSAIIWTYYLTIYVKIDLNARDWYVYTWLTVISFVLDEIYFIFRYYNLYLDLKENNEIITEEELSDMTAKTYVRFYLICGNYVFVDPHSVVGGNAHKEVIDTPFFTKRTVNGITLPEVKRIIQRMTDINDGELRFFYGRKSADLAKHSILRYFYFLDGDVSKYQDLDIEGEWMDFNRIKQIYSTNPGNLSSIMVADITRLATIILTEKTFDEEGMRKNPIKNYSPSFDLEDVRNSELDFQDDKWIRVSLFNSDTKMFKFKRWWRGIRGDKNNRSSWS
ncbi:MAG: hypothetical protein K2M67_00380 [Muribaculaceae bacterium]|nr:hypothetical protein [Muribaculaceae bacterium]